MSETQDAIQAAVNARIGTFTVKDLLEDLGWPNTTNTKSTIFNALTRMERWREVAKAGLREDGQSKWREWIKVE